jgi:hypothetical protein
VILIHGGWKLEYKQRTEIRDGANQERHKSRSRSSRCSLLAHSETRVSQAKLRNKDKRERAHIQLGSSRMDKGPRPRW